MKGTLGKEFFKLNSYTIAVMVVAVLRHKCALARYGQIFQPTNLPSTTDMLDWFLDFFGKKYPNGDHIVSIVAQSLVQIQKSADALSENFTNTRNW